jgi:hypothetical protein
VQQFPSAHEFTAHNAPHSFLRDSSAPSCSLMGSSVPQTELPVTGSVAVPVGERLHPALQPWALHDEGGERRGRHGCGWSAVRWCVAVLRPSIAVLTVWSGEGV